MFGFFKKKEKTPEPQVQEIILSDEEKNVIKEKINQLLSELESSSLTVVDQAKKYEKIGLHYSELNEVDTAISSLEKSLELKLSMGDGYKKLMSLYNKKRAQAAQNKDDDKIEYYMSKMDDMRNIAKKLTLTGE